MHVHPAEVSSQVFARQRGLFCLVGIGVRYFLIKLPRLVLTELFITARSAHQRKSGCRAIALRFFRGAFVKLDCVAQVSRAVFLHESLLV